MFLCSFGDVYLYWKYISIPINPNGTTNLDILQARMCSLCPFNFLVVISLEYNTISLEQNKCDLRKYVTSVILCGVLRDLIYSVNVSPS